MKAVISARIYNFFLVNHTNGFVVTSKLYEMDKLFTFLSHCKGRRIEVEILDESINELVQRKNKELKNKR